MAGRWGAVTVLGAAQFVMVLDSTVMNVSISTVVADLHTTIAAMQTAITFYTLTMAAFMLLGAKLGDVWGRKRALIIGSIVYAIGSLTTALSPNIVVLFLGWSIVEGLGAVLVVLPAPIRHGQRTNGPQPPKLRIKHRGHIPMHVRVVRRRTRAGRRGVGLLL